MQRKLSFVKRGAQLSVERLEERTLASATTTLLNGVLTIRADDRGDYLVLSTPKAGVTEVFEADNRSTRDFTGVASVVFTGGRGSDSLYNNTAIPLVAKAHNDPRQTTVFNGGTSGQDVLDGSGSKGNFYASLNASGTEIGGSGWNNLFALAGTHTITTGSGRNGVYSIVGADSFNATAGTGYLLVSAKAAKVTAGKAYQIVTFFQPQFQGPQTQAAAVQADANGNNILYLNPLNPAANVNYTVSQLGGPVRVDYSDSTGASQSLNFRQPVAWVAFFSIAGVSKVFVNAPIKTVLYGKSGSILVGGPEAEVNVLKIHSGSGTAIGRAAFNDLFAGPAGTTSGATLANNGGLAVFRNAADKISTVDFGTGNRDTILIGPPAQADGTPVGRAGQAPQNQDFWQLYNELATL